MCRKIRCDGESRKFLRTKQGLSVSDCDSEGESEERCHGIVTIGPTCCAECWQPISGRIRACFDWKRKFLGVTSDVSEGCREGFLETNKKTNYMVRQETTRQIY